MTSHQILIDKLDEFIRKYYKNQLIKGGLYSFSAVLLFYISVTVLEYFAHFDTLVRTFLFYAFLATASYILIRLVIIPLMRLNKLGSVISHEQAAEIIGKHFGTIQDKLLNVLQLKQLSQDHIPGVTINSQLLEAGINQKIKELKPIPFASAIDLSQNRKYLKYAIPPFLAITMILFASPGIITDGTKRLVEHRTFFEKPAPFQFTIQNKALKTVQQEDFLLEIKVTGEEIPDDAYIEINENQFKLTKESKLLFEHLFKNVQKSTRFKLFADGFYSREYELVALPNPIVLNFDIELKYPKYTGKKDETLKNTGDLIIPAGTKVKWNFNTRNAKALKMRFNDSTQVLTPLSSDLYTYSKRFLKSSAYSIKTANEYLTSKDSVVYAIQVIADLHPGIEVEERADSLSSKRIYFRGNIKDDYGFKRLIFNYKHNSGNESSKGINSEIPINKSQTQDQFFHFWDLSALNVNAGDEIEYFFEVWDNDGVNGSKSTKTKKMIFKAPSLKEISENAEKNNQEIKKDIESNIKEARDLQKELNELNKKLLEKKTLGWEEKKKVESLLNRQKELQKKVEKTQKHSTENFKEQSEYKKVDERILEKQQQLEELLNEVLSDEMKEMLKQLEKLMEELNKDKLQEAIDEMKLDNKDLEKELDRSLELYKQLEFEQKMQETIEKLEELSKKQEELSEKSEEKNADTEELKDKQDELNKAFEDIKKDLDNLEEKNEELERPNDMEDTKEEEKNIEEEMQKSSEQLQNNKNKKASESQKNASEKMQDLAEKMEKMQAGNEEEKAEEDLNALRDILENLVSLSFGQESLMEELTQTDKTNPQYVKKIQQQKKLKDDSKMIEDSLFALSKRVPQLDAIVNREISAINMNMEKAIDNMEDRQTPSAGNRQQLVMTSVNNLALLLSEVVKQMQEQMGQQKQGEGSCNKPGASGKPKPSAASMRKMQQQINQQMQKLKEQMEKNGGPEKGGKSGGKEMSQQLVKLAAQQEALRNQLQKISQELGKDGKGGTGNLDKLTKKMEETETDLVNKKISQETIKRQQEILTRLLEAENAEREREMDEKRESKEIKNENFSNPSDFYEYKRLKQKEAELLKTVPLTLFPFYKKKVSEYFNNIEE